MSEKVQTEFLNEIVTILQQGLKSSDTFQAVFKLLEKTIPFTSATLFLFNEKKNKLDVMHHQGDYIADLASDIKFERGMGISSYISRQKEPIVLESLDKSRPGKDKRFSSYLSIPLWVGEKLIGVLNMGHNNAGYYNIFEKEDYKIVGTQISMIVEKINLRTQLEKELTEALGKLSNTQKVLIEKEKLATNGEIAVTVNHEINNPLTSIIGMAEILEIAYNAGNSTKVLEGLKGILKQARKIQRVVEKLNKVKKVKSVNYHGETDMLEI